MRPRDEAEAKAEDEEEEGRTLRYGAVRRCVIWVCIAQYAVLHVAFSLAQRTLEDRVSCTFHFSFITVVFAGWAVAYGDAMPHAMTLIFTALEALGCAVHAALPVAGQGGGRAGGGARGEQRGAAGGRGGVRAGAAAAGAGDVFGDGGS